MSNHYNCVCAVVSLSSLVTRAAYFGPLVCDVIYLCVFLWTRILWQRPEKILVFDIEKRTIFSPNYSVSFLIKKKKYDTFIEK